MCILLGCAIIENPTNVAQLGKVLREMIPHTTTGAPKGIANEKQDKAYGYATPLICVISGFLTYKEQLGVLTNAGLHEVRQVIARLESTYSGSGLAKAVDGMATADNAYPSNRRTSLTPNNDSPSYSARSPTPLSTSLTPDNDSSSRSSSPLSRLRFRRKMSATSLTPGNDSPRHSTRNTRCRARFRRKLSPVSTSSASNGANCRSTKPHRVFETSQASENDPMCDNDSDLGCPSPETVPRQDETLSTYSESVAGSDESTTLQEAVGNNSSTRDTPVTDTKIDSTSATSAPKTPLSGGLPQDMRKSCGDTMAWTGQNKYHKAIALLHAKKPETVQKKVARKRRSTPHVSVTAGRRRRRRSNPSARKRQASQSTSLCTDSDSEDESCHPRRHSQVKAARKTKRGSAVPVSGKTEFDIRHRHQQEDDALFGSQESISKRRFKTIPYRVKRKKIDLDSDLLW